MILLIYEKLCNCLSTNFQNWQDSWKKRGDSCEKRENGGWMMKNDNKEQYL
jgi:hypothetical protein